MQILVEYRFQCQCQGEIAAQNRPFQRPEYRMDIFIVTLGEETTTISDEFGHSLDTDAVSVDRQWFCLFKPVDEQGHDEPAYASLAEKRLAVEHPRSGEFVIPNRIDRTRFWRHVDDTRRKFRRIQGHEVGRRGVGAR